MPSSSTVKAGPLRTSTRSVRRSKMIRIVLPGVTRASHTYPSTSGCILLMVRIIMTFHEYLGASKHKKTRRFVQQLIQQHFALLAFVWGESAGDLWIPLTKCQRENIHVMTSPWIAITAIVSEDEIPPFYFDPFRLYRSSLRWRCRGIRSQPKGSAIRVIIAFYWAPEQSVEQKNNVRWPLNKACYHTILGLYSLRRRRLVSIGIPIINLRRSSDRLMFIMGIPIPIRRRLLSE